MDTTVNFIRFPYSHPFILVKTKSSWCLAEMFLTLRLNSVEEMIPYGHKLIEMGATYGPCLQWLGGGLILLNDEYYSI